MSQGWFNTLTSKPVSRSIEEIAADMWITAERKRLQAEQAAQGEREAQEKAERDANTPKGSSVAAFEARKHLLPECADHFQRHALLTGGKATTV